MSRLIVLTAMTVDGVMTVEEWFVPEGDHMEASLRLFEGDTALLYGRKNYEGLAAYWMAAEGEWADLLNPMPKFVASRTLREPLTWNATLTLVGLMRMLRWAQVPVSPYSLAYGA